MRALCFVHALTCTLPLLLAAVLLLVLLGGGLRVRCASRWWMHRVRRC